MTDNLKRVIRETKDRHALHVALLMQLHKCSKLQATLLAYSAGPLNLDELLKPISREPSE